MNKILLHDALGGYIFPVSNTENENKGRQIGLIYYARNYMSQVGNDKKAPGQKVSELI